MGLFMYLLAMGVWVGLIEAALYQMRHREYRRIEAMRDQAEALLHEARLARLRTGVALHKVPAMSSPYTERRAS